MTEYQLKTLQSKIVVRSKMGSRCGNASLSDGMEVLL